MVIGPTNRLPLALLGILDFPSQGRYPNALEETIRSTIEILDIIAASNREYVQDSRGVTGNGTIDIATVPAGEMWYVDTHGIGASTNATEAIGLATGVQTTWGGTAYRRATGHGRFSLGTGALAGVSSIFLGLDRPYFALAGDVVQTHILQCTTAGSITVNSLVGFLRISI